MTYEWQKSNDGEYPVLEVIDLKVLKEALQKATGREDVRIRAANHQSNDDHVYLSLGVEIR